MSPKKLIIVDEISVEAAEVLDRHRDQISFEAIPAGESFAAARDADFLIVRSTVTIDENFLQNCEKLRLIVMAGTGVDHIDLEAASRRGVLVMSTPEANATAAADLTLALLLSHCRKLTTAFESIRRGEWTRERNPILRQSLRGLELKGKVAGLIGLGHVGKRVATRLQSFETQVIACDPYLSKKEARGIPLVELDRIFKESDIISLHIPLTSETRSLIGRSQIEKCERSPLLINTSRGAVVDETAIIEGLRNAKLSGYAADVFVNEPLATSHPFLTAPQVLLTPHIGAQTAEAQAKVSLLAVQRVIDFLLHGTTEHVLNLKRKKKARK